MKPMTFAWLVVTVSFSLCTRSICNIWGGVCPDGYEWLNTSCYWLGDTLINRQAADVTCRTQNSSLGSIETPEELEILRSWIQASHGSTPLYWWLSGRLVAEPNFWQWENGEYISYTMWGENEPTGNSETVVALKSVEALVDAPAEGFNMGTLCEFEVRPHFYSWETKSVSDQLNDGSLDTSIDVGQKPLTFVMHTSPFQRLSVDVFGRNIHNTAKCGGGTLLMMTQASGHVGAAACAPFCGLPTVCLETQMDGNPGNLDQIRFTCTCPEVECNDLVIFVFSDDSMGSGTSMQIHHVTDITKLS